jgi:peptidoglycan hydrolase FlgJ
VDILLANMARFSSIGEVTSLSSDAGRQLEEVATEFEALFVKQMLDAMRKTLRPENDLFYGGMAQETFQDMLYEEYARKIAQTGNLGIAEVITRQYGAAAGTPSVPAATDSPALNITA